MKSDDSTNSYKIIKQITPQDLTAVNGNYAKYLIDTSTLSNSLMGINDSFFRTVNELTKSPALEIARSMEAHSKRISDSLNIQISPIIDSINILQKYTLPFYEQFSKIQNPLLELANSIQNPFNTMLQQTQYLQNQFDSIAKNTLGGFNDVLKNIPRSYYVRVKLESEYWIILDETLISSITENDTDESENVAPTVIEYYKNNRWKKLESLVETWKSQIHPNRLKVFNTIIAATVESRADQAQTNVHLLTVPSIIIQIDGLIRELTSFLPRPIKKRIEQEIRANLPPQKKKKGRKVDVRNDVTVQTIAELIDYWSAEVFQEIIFRGLFRNSNEIKAEESYALFRHKILHGDKAYVKQQNEENFVRLMLYADFIINIMKKIKVQKQKKKQALKKKAKKM